jgi:glucuronate isomerase
MCRMIGHWVAEGQAPADVKWLGKIVSDISFANARNFFDVDVK